MSAPNPVQIAELRPWLQKIRATIESKLGTEVQVILYGSYARGESGPESDVDLAVILPDRDKRSLDIVFEAAWQASLEAGKVFSVVPVAVWETRLLAYSPWFQTVQREGIVI